MRITIRKMSSSDIQEFYQAFQNQGWDKPISILKRYYEEQQNGKRDVFVATYQNEVAGYATLLPNDEHGAFANQNIPTVCDFNVFEPFQRKGIGTAILDAIESHVRQYNNRICLGVGLHSGYGAAQRLYIKRGYIPDGSGVWYQNRIATPYQPCINDDDLVLYLSKQL